VEKMDGVLAGMDDIIGRYRIRSPLSDICDIWASNTLFIVKKCIGRSQQLFQAIPLPPKWKSYPFGKLSILGLMDLPSQSIHFPR